MNIKVYLVLFIGFLFFSETLLAQREKKSSFRIEIPKTGLPIYKLDGKILDPDETEFINLNVPAKNWKLEIDNKDKTKKYKVVFKNTVSTDDSLVIEDLSTIKTFDVENDQIQQPEKFTFANNFNVLLKEGNKDISPPQTVVYTSGANSPPVIKDIVVHRTIGSAIYDAFYLKNGNSSPSKVAILAYYANCKPNEVAAAYKDNKFIKVEATKIATAQRSAPKISSLLASAGGLDVTNLADGVAKFLIKRTKEELNIAFFEDFRDFLKKEEFRDLQTVFPETSRTLDIIGDEIHNFERYIETLRESFKNDLGNLTTNLPTIIDNHPDFFNKYPELEATLRSGIYISEGIRDKVHPGDILADYPIEYLDKLTLPLKGSLQTLQLFSESLRDSSRSDSIYWVSTAELRKTVKDTAVFRIYIGLTYQLAKSKYNEIPITADTTLVELLDAVGPGKLQAYQNYVFRFIGKTDKLSKMIKEYTKPANDSLAIEQYYNYFRTSIDLLEYSLQIRTLPFIPEKLSALKTDTRDYFDIAYTTSDLVLDINRKNYSSAIRNTVHIYDVIKVKRSQKHQDSLRATIKILHKDIADTANADKRSELITQLSSSEAELKLEEESKNVMGKLLKYGSFMAGVVKAESSDEVEATIESFALPTGSSRIKRETPFNVALNGYLGVYYGWEKIRDVDRRGQGTYGITAPIGISISRGHSIFFGGTGKKGWLEGKRGWSTSLFISIIDVGAVASFRFKSSNQTDIVAQDTTTTTVNEIPTIKLKDIISPGALLSIGIPKTPLSVNLGAQVGPNLRKISVDSTSNTVANDYSDKMYWRFSFSLVVDIPIINFYTKSKK
jgi:hypothetical protein